jgi:hypothetical protein
MKKQSVKPISLIVLARQLGVTVDSVVARCRMEGIIIADPEDGPVRVSIGLAQTVKDWHRDGLLCAAQQPTTQAKRDAAIAYDMAQAADKGNSSFVFGIGSELDSMACQLREMQIGALTPRGRRLLRRAWREFETYGLEFEKWAECRKCGSNFMPVRNRDFVDAWLDAFVKKRKDQRRSDFRFFKCADCGGMPYTKIERGQIEE